MAKAPWPKLRAKLVAKIHGQNSWPKFMAEAHSKGCGFDESLVLKSRNPGMRMREIGLG
jgi:hypothetical protein